MKKIFLLPAIIAFLFIASPAKAFSGLWQQVDVTKVPAIGEQVLHPKKYMVYSLTTEFLKQELFLLSSNPSDGTIIELPLPDGSFMDFRVWQTSMMPDELAAKYANIKTFTAEAVGKPTITAKLDFTEFGFHAMIFNGANTSFIDPYTRQDQNYYLVHYKKDEYRSFSERMRCLVHSNAIDELQQGEPMTLEETPLPKLAFRLQTGYKLQSYRLALSADYEYCQAATGSSTPSLAQALSCMTTSMNRINGVYEREFSITMNFTAKEDTLIWTQSTGTINGNDPFNNPTNIDANANSCLGKNQSICDARIGSANYDIGHVFTTGAGGLSWLGVICKSGQKAKSVTGSSTPVGDGFDIDYVAHEMGHEFGADHPFNTSDGSCGGNGVATCAYEPGSGSTIMAYAGICGPDDLQYHSDAYFHAISLTQISNYAIIGSGAACAVKTASGNKPVGIAAFTATYSIPFLTPFELIAPTAADSVLDTSTTYCWEQWNLGDFGTEFINTHLSGPIFRSFDPSTSPTRVFPTISMVLAGTLSNAGTEGAEGEKAPDVARYLSFILTLRDIFQGNGSFLIPDDSIHLNVINTTTGFKVTSQNTAVSYAGNTAQTVTWDVVTTDASPISCANVNIYLSTDGGYTWPTLIGNYPNNGSASIHIPNVATTNTARIKVKGAGNVFFNVNGSNFTITHNVSVNEVSAFANSIKVFPVPASNTLNIRTGPGRALNSSITNSVGQTVWKGPIYENISLPVSQWAKGIYFLRVSDPENGNKIVRAISID